MNVEIVRSHEDAIIPSYQTKGSSGFDLSSIEGCNIKPGERKILKTGLKIAIPEGFELQIRSRSGCSIKQGLVVLNSPGTVDSDFRQEIGIIIINVSNIAIDINPGDRIAQGVVCPVMKIKFIEVSSLNETERIGGFGSTDKIKL